MTRSNSRFLGSVDAIDFRSSKQKGQYNEMVYITVAVPCSTNSDLEVLTRPRVNDLSIAEVLQTADSLDVQLAPPDQC